jgi:hypothetical protein
MKVKVMKKLASFILTSILFCSNVSFAKKFNFYFSKKNSLINLIKVNKNRKRRRITAVEKHLIHSKGARLVRVNGKSVYKRKVFQCNRINKAEMLKGNSPFGLDGKRVELHHLKQQNSGKIVEMTQEEHKKFSSILHRYTNSSEIDRKEFTKWRKKYWKQRAIDCMK